MNPFDMMNFSKKRAIVFLPVESARREFDGKMVLTARLLERGFGVMVGTKSGIHREILHAHKGIYLAKSASNIYLDLYQKLKKLGHHLAVLDVEGGALTRDIRSDLLRSYQPESAPFFDFFYVFGEKIREAMIRDLPYIRPDQIVVTGEPRFDLLREGYNHFFQDQMEEIRRQFGEFILINTSFGLSNSILGDDGIRNFLETTIDIPDEQRPLYLLKHQEGKWIMKAFISLVQCLSEQFPETNFVLRPHPDEDPHAYLEVFAESPNVFVRAEGNVHPWIKASAGVIHHDCTTGMEAVMAGKPTLSYVPRMEESVTAWLPVYLSMACTREEEVAEVLREVLQNPGQPYHPGTEKADVFRQYFVNYSDEAGILLAEALTTAYGRETTSTISSPVLCLRRFRSIINILRYKMQTGKRVRFMAVNKREAMLKIRSLGLSDKQGKLKIRVRGGNVLQLAFDQKKR